MQNTLQDISRTYFEFPSYFNFSHLLKNLTDTASQCIKIMQMDKQQWQKLAGNACPGMDKQVSTQEKIVKEKLSCNFLIATTKECFTVLQTDETDWQQFSCNAYPDRIKHSYNLLKKRYKS